MDAYGAYEHIIRYFHISIIYIYIYIYIYI